jgi:hypothetical protein
MAKKKTYIVEAETNWPSIIQFEAETEQEIPFALEWREAKKALRALYLHKIAELRQLKEKDVK